MFYTERPLRPARAPTGTGEVQRGTAPAGAAAAATRDPPRIRERQGEEAMFWRRALATFVIFLFAFGSTAATNAQTALHCPPGQQPRFVFGFAVLKQALGPTMGDPVTCEYPDPNGTGDVLQQTTTGLAFWRKRTNTPTFTDGYRHWALVSTGLVFWEGSSIDPPGTASAGPTPPPSRTPPPPTPTPPPAPPCSVPNDAVKADFSQRADGMATARITVRNPCSEPQDLEVQVFSVDKASKRTVTDAPTAFFDSVAPGGTMTVQIGVPIDPYAAASWIYCTIARLLCDTAPEFRWQWFWHRTGDRASFCIPVGADRCLKADPWLYGTIIALRQFEEGQWLLKVAAGHGVQVRRERTDVGVLGTYNRVTRTAIIDTRLDAYSTWVRAAVLAHELQHAADDAAGKWPKTSAECYRAEEDAFRREASVWGQLWSYRLPPDLTSVHEELNDIALTVARDPVGFAVSLVSRYYGECVHRD